MIILYPTGLYDDVLPHQPQDSQNITFLISNTPPPRTSLLFPKIPVGVANRQRPPDTLTPEQRRITVGALIFTVSSASRTQTGNNSKQYEIGEIFGFDNVWLKATDPMLASDKTEIQHNLNMYNYPELGLTENDVDLINEQSLSTFNTITNRLNYLRVARADAEVRINTNQKIINEANKNITALVIMIQTAGVTDSDVEDLLVKLRTRKAIAEIALQQAITDANTSAAEAENELQKLRAVGMVLK
jgi:hypothetical protein